MSELSRVALVFPGQGCQFVGMGADLYERYAEARAVYARADQTLGFPLSQMCFQGPEEALNDTANTQPAIYATTLALWEVLRPRLAPLRPRICYVAGHSLGEFTALAAAGAFGFEEGLRLVRCRGEAMRDAGAEAPGGMAAIIGLDDHVVEEIVAEACGPGGEGVWIANLNSPGQVVIAGRNDALQRAIALAQARKAKRALPLTVSVACHTPLMGAASERLNVALEATAFEAPWAPVVSNAEAAPLSEPAAIKAALMRQLSSPVRWVESVTCMTDAGVTTMLEIGPKAVVSGLIKRIARDVELHSVTDASSLEAFDAEALLA